MVQYSNSAKTCQQSEKDGTILKQSQNLSTVRKRWYNTQTEQKHVISQKKMVQYSNSAKTWHQLEKMVQYSNSAKTWYQSEKACTILKQSKNLSPVRKRWSNTQTGPKPANSQKKKLGAKRATSQRTQQKSEPNPARKKMVQCSNSQKKMVQYSNSAKTCHQSEKDGTILKQCQNLSPVRKRWYNTKTEQPAISQKRWHNTQTGSKPVIIEKRAVQYSSRTKWSDKCPKRGSNLLFPLTTLVFPQGPPLGSYPAAARSECWSRNVQC